ncbi:MAG: hypothetical protein KF781_01990 [Chitinophagaceae bacterium]|nr:hypothetical protein [Chitinophagaceae bacterium]MCW5904279.1 hypothetical protein [Chitinophagaceae bacterium]
MDSKFQLEYAINAFVQDIAEKGTVTALDEKELKSHLHETIQNLTTQQLTEEEAFVVAKLRMGNTEILAQEYKKVNGVNMLNKEWVFIFLGIALTIVAKTFLMFADYYITHQVFLNKLTISAGAYLLSACYLLLAFLAILLFIKGEVFTKFIKAKLLDNNVWAMALFVTFLGFITTIMYGNFIGSPFKGYLDTHINVLYYNNFAEAILRGTVPVTVVLGLLFSTQSVNKKFGWGVVFTSNYYLYSFLLGFGAEFVAALFGRMLFTNGIIIESVFFGITYFICAYNFFKYNPTMNLLHFCLFISTSLFVECFWGYFNKDFAEGIGKLTAPFAWAFIIAVFLAFIAAKRKWKKPVV